MRGGKETSILVEEIVMGDVVVLREGEAIKRRITKKFLN